MGLQISRYLVSFKKKNQNNGQHFPLNIISLIISFNGHLSKYNAQNFLGISACKVRMTHSLRKKYILYFSVYNVYFFA